MLTRKSVLLGLMAFLFAGVAFGGEAIRNWPAPATWSPPRSHGLAALSETSPLPFQAVSPCRVVDTRGTVGVPINTGGKFSVNEIRTWTFAGLCGIPASAAAVSLNVTVTGTDAHAFGFVAIWPAGVTEPNVSTLNWSAAGVTESNAAIVPFGTGGSAGKISLQSANAGSNVIVDVNGYYSDGALGALASGERFTLLGDVSGNVTGLLSVHNTQGASQARAGYFVADSSGNGSTGIAGIETATSGLTAGVYGQANSSTGNTAGVSGIAIATTGRVYGVYGQSNSAISAAAGVFGVDGSADPGVGTILSAGVRGASINGLGVFGVSQNIGVLGRGLDSTGAELTSGLLGQFGYGVYSNGDFGGTGAKYFVEPHPSDASKVIRYVSLEGPESGTYFRGTARTIHGEAIIEVPESFRMVTDEQGLTVQLTPVGALATLAVISQDLDRVVVRSSKDVTFHYLAQGVRRAFKDHQAISDGKEFLPESAKQRMPLYLTEEAKRRLVANGTYNADGTVNMETAERLGWAKAWKDREKQARAPEAAAGQGVAGDRR